jgi:hypothetical protein
LVLPSFQTYVTETRRIKPRIYVLEIRDRDVPDGEPIAELFVEREESCKRYQGDDSVYEASMVLSYGRIGPTREHRIGDQGTFCGGFCRGYGDGPSVSLTSTKPISEKGGVFVDLPRGQRIGTYLMNEIVTWAKQWPEATVASVELLASDAHAENKARRNWFYEQFGLVFDYEDPDHCAGQSKPMLAAALTPVETWKQNIRERDVRDYVAELVDERDWLRAELADRKRAVRELVNDIKQAEARPVRWVVRQLWRRFSEPLVGGTIALIIGAIVWAKLRS